jgi:hypothetical protein
MSSVVTVRRAVVHLAAVLTAVAMTAAPAYALDPPYPAPVTEPANNATVGNPFGLAWSFTATETMPDGQPWPPFINYFGQPTDCAVTRGLDADQDGGFHVVAREAWNSALRRLEAATSPATDPDGSFVDANVAYSWEPTGGADAYMVGRRASVTTPGHYWAHASTVCVQPGSRGAVVGPEWFSAPVSFTVRMRTYLGIARPRLFGYGNYGRATFIDSRRPPELYLRAGRWLTRVRWRGWGTDRAVGRGRLSVRGRPFGQATATLSRPRAELSPGRPSPTPLLPDEPPGPRECGGSAGVVRYYTRADVRFPARAPGGARLRIMMRAACLETDLDGDVVARP